MSVHKGHNGFVRVCRAAVWHIECNEEGAQHTPLWCASTQYAGGGQQIFKFNRLALVCEKVPDPVTGEFMIMGLWLSQPVEALGFALDWSADPCPKMYFMAEHTCMMCAKTTLEHPAESDLKTKTRLCVFRHHIYGPSTAFASLLVHV